MGKGGRVEVALQLNEHFFSSDQVRIVAITWCACWQLRQQFLQAVNDDRRLQRHKAVVRLEGQSARGVPGTPSREKREMGMAGGTRRPGGMLVPGWLAGAALVLLVTLMASEAG